MADDVVDEEPQAAPDEGDAAADAPEPGSVEANVQADILEAMNQAESG
ncbi:MAG: hypothetical protein QOE44_2435, partial [Solirubrobacteraceae bacterium]|nr:hypothetical protein [Solirubrobacteraceae bacterium]